GYAATTMADISDGAGLSRGIVNFHFESKDKLLVATLQFLSEEYAAHWQAAYDAAAPRAAHRLWALVAADFDRRITTRRKIAAWCAFWGEAKSRPVYQALCGARDARYQQVILDLLEALRIEGGYDYIPERQTLALCAMLEGLWFRLLMGDGLTREEAHRAAADYLAAVFPRHLGPLGPLS
ncbi:TetR family transcriptional regulator, partial [Thioclava sp. BHET1]